MVLILVIFVCICHVYFKIQKSNKLIHKYHMGCLYEFHYKEVKWQRIRQIIGLIFLCFFEGVLIGGAIAGKLPLVPVLN